MEDKYRISRLEDSHEDLEKRVMITETKLEVGHKVFDQINKWMESIEQKLTIHIANEDKWMRKVAMMVITGLFSIIIGLVMFVFTLTYRGTFT